MGMLKFVLAAHRHGHAYIDMDGCMLHKMPIPEHVPAEQALAYWMANLCPTRLVMHRLVLIYILRAMGVQVHLWTNRSPQHAQVTQQSFGRHYRLFASHHYGAGYKRHLQRQGPCMDDEERNIGDFDGDWQVKPVRCRRDLLSLWTPN